jgi:2-amino-4-hydroxy-6-hydroxymethyldihydropteridine diphosphokinase
LQGDARLRDVRCSTLHATAPIGGPTGQPAFVNAAASFTTDLSPPDVYSLLRRLEEDFGRTRRERWGPRTLDLDLLLYDDQILSTVDLTLPHPRMAFRRFVLAPAVEVAAQMREPGSGLTVKQLWDHLAAAPPYVALAGACWFAKQYVAAAAVARLHAQSIAASVSQTRGVTVLGAPTIADPEHPFVEHFVELMPRLGDDIRTSLAARERWLVSSFWPGEVELGAQLWFDGAARDAAQAAVQEALGDLPAPRLLVYLQTQDDELLAPPGAREYQQRLAAHRDALDAHLARPRGIPVLRLAASRPEAAIEDLTAAVLAMQPLSA